MHRSADVPSEVPRASGKPVSAQLRSGPPHSGVSRWLAGYLLALGLILGGLMPAVAAAAPPEQERAKALYAEGKQAFNDGRFDVAATLFKQAWDTYQDAAYLFNVALAYERKQRWRLAVEYYDRFLEAAPGSPAAPEVKARRDAAEEARKAARGEVTINSPAKAKATVKSVGGTASCETPCVFKVEPGPVSVIVHAGEKTARASRTLAARERWTPTLDFGQRAEMGELTIELSDPGGRIMVGKWPATAGQTLSVPAGEHLVRVLWPGRTPVEQRITVAAGSTRTLNIALDSSEPLGDPGSGQRIAGYALVGVGGAALVNGIVFAVLAKGSYDDAIAVRDGVRTPDTERELQDLREDVSTQSTVADVSFGLAAVSTAVGLILWFTAPEATDVTITARGGQTWSVIRF